MIFNGVTELELPECGAIDLFSCHVELVQGGLAKVRPTYIFAGT